MHRRLDQSSSLASPSPDERVQNEVLITHQLKQLNFIPKLDAGEAGVRRDGFGAGLGQDAGYVLGWWGPHPGLGLPGIKGFSEAFQKAFGRPPGDFAAVSTSGP